MSLCVYCYEGYMVRSTGAPRGGGTAHEPETETAMCEMGLAFANDQPAVDPGAEYFASARPARRLLLPFAGGPLDQGGGEEGGGESGEEDETVGGGKRRDKERKEARREAEVAAGRAQVERTGPRLTAPKAQRDAQTAVLYRPKLSWGGRSERLQQEEREAREEGL